MPKTKASHVSNVSEIIIIDNVCMRSNPYTSQNFEFLNPDVCDDCAAIAEILRSQNPRQPKK